MAVPLDIKTKESVPVEELLHNLIANKTAPYYKGIEYTYAPHDKSILLVSAGKSLTDNPYVIQKLVGKYDYISCVKHALPYLKKAQVIPHFVVNLDPRPLTGVSTLGKVREELFKDPHALTTYLIASTAHPSIAEYLVNHGAKVRFWDSVTEVMNVEESIAYINQAIGGGSNSAMRSFSLYMAMGFKKIGFLGYDSYVDPPEDPVTEPYHVLKVNHNKYWATGELAAQVQDLQDMLKDVPRDVQFTCHSGGLAKELYDRFRTEFDFETEYSKWRTE